MLRFLRVLFSFKVPVIEELTCLRLYVRQRPCLLLQWHIRYATSVRIHPLRRSYRIGRGSLLLTIPNNVTAITIQARNLWGRAQRQELLRSITLDATTEEALSVPGLVIRPVRPVLKTFRLFTRSYKLVAAPVKPCPVNARPPVLRACVRPDILIFKDPSQ